TVFAAGTGGALASLLLQYRLELDLGNAWWIGGLVAVVVSGVALGQGARYLMRQLRSSPASLLRGLNP
ncbi:hypothetical protein RZS08_44700, partial [Arthrospira platensis SPKY1]|nr:hypothetical protein [Arthrospira platensis SPKY1]